MYIKRFTTTVVAAAILAGIASPSLAAEVTVTKQDKIATEAAFDRIFNQNSFWYQKLPDDTPKASDSDQIVTTMKSDASKRAAFSYNRRPNLTVNTYQYSPTMYVVDENTPRKRVHFFNAQNKPTNDVFVWQIFNTKDAPMRSVPIPEGAVPAGGTDGEITVYDKSTDTLYEMWQLKALPDGSWQATWGSAIKNASAHRGVFDWPTGVTAAGLPLAGGTIMAHEFENGINHVIGLAIPYADKGEWQFPANRTDGRAHPEGKPTPQQGQMLRLPADLNVDALGLPKAATEIARAARDYGIVIWDTSPSFSFRAENPNSLSENPYGKIFLNGAAYDDLAEFPWDKLEVLPEDYSPVAQANMAQKPVLQEGATSVTIPGVWAHKNGGQNQMSLFAPSPVYYASKSDLTYELKDESIRDDFNFMWGDGYVSPSELGILNSWITDGKLSRSASDTKYQHFPNNATVVADYEAAKLEYEAAKNYVAEPEPVPPVVEEEDEDAPVVETDQPVTFETTYWTNFDKGPLEYTLERTSDRLKYHSKHVAQWTMWPSVKVEFDKLWEDGKVSGGELTKFGKLMNSGYITKSERVWYFKPVTFKKTYWGNFDKGLLEYTASDVSDPGKYHSYHEVSIKTNDQIQRAYANLWKDGKLSTADIAQIAQWKKNGEFVETQTKVQYYKPR